jgi:hypothetical protein
VSFALRRTVFLDGQVDGRDFRRETIEVRKTELARLIRGIEPGVQLREHIEHDDAIVFEHACKLGLEGIVLSSPPLWRHRRAKHDSANRIPTPLSG